MNVRISLAKDNLDELGLPFAMATLTKPVFVNSVPKCGTHLIRNIMRMFVAPHQQYQRDFVQWGNLHLHNAAFWPQQPFLAWGHLLHGAESAVLTKPVNHLVMVRDPYDWVLARTRFFLSDQFQGNLNLIKNNAAAIEDVMNIMIFGSLEKAPSLSEIFTLNAVAWMGTGAHMLRYEELVGHVKALGTPEAEAYFRDLIVNKAGIAEWPADWRQRIEIGSDRRYSGTAREHLRNDVVVPEVLPETQKRLVDYHAPGLRAILGYA